MCAQVKAGNQAFRSFSVTVNKSLVSISVSPSSASIDIGDGVPFQATGRFTDGTTAILPSGEGGGGNPLPSGGDWHVHFDSMLSTSGCSPGHAGFSSQSFFVDGGGGVNGTWGSPAIIQAAGTVPPQQVNLTLTCVVTNAPHGTIVANWAGTSVRVDGADKRARRGSTVAPLAWSAGPAMLSQLSGMGAAVARNALYVFGATTSGGERLTHQFRLGIGLQPNQEAGWSALSRMPTGRGEAAAAAVGDDIYVMGGQVSGQALSPAPLEVFSAPPPYDFSVPLAGGGGGSSLPAPQWQSTNPAVAGINSSGFAQGVGEGQTTIVATANGISCTATDTCATLTVVDPDCASVVLSISGNVPFTTIPASVNGDPDLFEAPFGVNTFTIRPGTYTLEFVPPAGYQATPNPVMFTAGCGDTAQASVVVSPIDTTPPVLTLPAGITADATSANGAIVTYAASALDAIDGPRPVICSPGPGSLFPIGTTTVTCSASDTSGNGASGAFTVAVLDPAQVIAAMIAELGDFGQGERLLQNLLSSLDRNTLDAACGQLGAFINAVRAQAGKSLTGEEAEALEARAQGVRGVLGCS